MFLAKHQNNIKIYGQNLQMLTIFLDSSKLIISQILIKMQPPIINFETPQAWKLLRTATHISLRTQNKSQEQRCT